MSEQEQAQYAELLELARDIVHPEQYAHAMPGEVIRRAWGVLKMTEARSSGTAEEVRLERE